MDNEYHQIMPKISGYLEKKGRKKMMSCYKKYWFVLEGRLLLYYKSKDEYDAISPCKGSITLGPTSNVKPCSSNTGVFQIESKTTTITLRAETREDQRKWMHALISALNQGNDFKKLNHFRHSVGELSPTSKKVHPLERQNTLPERFNACPDNTDTMTIIGKLQKLGAKSYGIGSKLQRSKTTLERQKQISFSDESIPSSSSFKTDFRFRKTESDIIESEEYGKLDVTRRANSIESDNASSEGIYERIPSNDSVFMRREILDQANRTTYIADNDMYWDRCRVQKVNGSTECCYQAIDYNENNIRSQIRKLSESFDKEEGLYAEADVKESADNGNSVEYADIEAIENAVGVQQYVEIDDVVRNNSISSEESTEDKDKTIFGFSKRNRTLKEKPEEKKKKVKKSESFLQRVWNKKSKNKKNKTEISLSNNNLVEKLDITDGVAIKTLGELQNILKKQNSVVKELYESRLLGQCIAEIEEKGEQRESEMIRNDLYIDSGTLDPTPVKNQELTCPSLPPRNQNQDSIPHYHEVPSPQPPLVPPKFKKRINSVLLDDILRDLDNQSEIQNKSLEGPKEDEDFQNKEGKVRELIKRFSYGKEEGVELRKKTDWKLKSQISETNDLEKLLDDLTKVTTAPILTPGVTTSLINPEISDKEIMEMVPIRQRRMSDPDYDIPRPHRSLTSLPKKDDNALQATRFFGPILKPSDYENQNRPPTPPADYHSNLPSITPDSLEVECRKIDLSHDELRKISFESHDYLSHNKTSHHNLDFLVENNLYADPRLLFKSRHDFSAYVQGANFTQVEEHDPKFIDSLEP